MPNFESWFKGFLPSEDLDRFVNDPIKKIALTELLKRSYYAGADASAMESALRGDD